MIYLIFDHTAVFGVGIRVVSILLKVYLSLSLDHKS